MVSPIIKYNIRTNNKLNKNRFKFLNLIDLLNNRNDMKINKPKFSNEASRNINEPLIKEKGFENTL